jgi:hypothetical protein
MGPRKTLYLDGRSAVRVQRAGPALEVQVGDQAAAWYPLQRLSAIVCRGRVGWRGDALQACVQQGLVVAFLDLDDRCVGMASGLPAGQLNLGARLELASVRPGWPQRYETWLRAQHHRRAHYTCQALGWSADHDLRRLRQRLTADVHDRLGPDCEPGLRRLSSLLQVDIAAELAQAGLGPDQLLGLGPAGHLPDDLLSLLQWPLRGRLLGARRMGPIADMRAAAALYHQTLRPGLLATCGRIVASLWSLGP